MTSPTNSCFKIWLHNGLKENKLN